VHNPAQILTLAELAGGFAIKLVVVEVEFLQIAQVAGPGDVSDTGI